MNNNLAEAKTCWQRAMRRHPDEQALLSLGMNKDWLEIQR
jgi:hypothetical protein